VPLNPLAIQSALLRMASDKPNDRSEVAQRWAEAYDNYARAASGGGAPGAFTGGEKLRLEKLLLAALLPSTGVPATVAAAWTTGVLSYWTIPPVVFGTAVVNPAIAGLAALTPALTTLLAAPNQDSVFASTMASLLDTVTRTVLVQFPNGATAPLL